MALELTPRTAFILRTSLLVWNTIAPVLSPTREGEKEDFLEWLYEVAQSIDEPLLEAAIPFGGADGSKVAELDENDRALLAYCCHNLGKAEQIRAYSDAGAVDITKELLKRALIQQGMVDDSPRPGYL